MNTKGKQTSIVKRMIELFLLLTAIMISVLPAGVFASNSLATINIGGTSYGANQYTAGGSDPSAGNNTLDKDALLRSMLTQMQYQDPTDPQDNSEYLAQLAEKSSIEQQENVSSGLSGLSNPADNIDSSLLIGQLSNMIGREISWQGEADGTGGPTQYTGVVKGIKIVDGVPTVVANDGERDHYVRTSAIISVSEPGAPENTASVLSEGNLAIITAVAGAAVGFCLGGFLLGRKKKPAFASAEDEE